MPAPSASSHAERVAEILRSDPLRWRLLGLVADLELPDGWISAGFVRNAVWDALHHRSPSPPAGDVDVIWFDPEHAEPERDRDLELKLQRAEPSVDWSVKNQARMHARNGDAPYTSASDAMRFWPETATAVAARRTATVACEIAAPLGLQDLIGLIARPAGEFAHRKRPIFDQRISQKRWVDVWPRLTVVEPH
ncbi:MAG: nucleotidyltransferase family protein [Pseudomonadota bacterium]